MRRRVGPETPLSPQSPSRPSTASTRGSPLKRHNLVKPRQLTWTPCAEHKGAMPAAHLRDRQAIELRCQPYLGCTRAEPGYRNTYMGVAACCQRLHASFLVPDLAIAGAPV